MELGLRKPCRSTRNPFRIFFFTDEDSKARGVYYVNAMETPVSCMETEAIGAKNVALAVCAALSDAKECPPRQ